MADDPNRDILPVKESSCADTCRSNIDPRERHLVYKLDRYDLEDRYLRLLEEVNSLKKLTNSQEDKIKRLSTKLMRATATPRTSNVVVDVYDDKNRIITLELENSKLKDKIAVLRNQLLSHKISGRSSSRNHIAQGRPPSGRITCRSECSRTKIPYSHYEVETGDDDNQAQNNSDKVENVDSDKKEMAEQIAELKKQLANCAASDQRRRVSENVEYIKVWRQMQQLNEKLIAAENTNKLLNGQIDELKWKLEMATKKNNENATELLAEKKWLAEMDELAIKAKESELSLREKDEQIKDLTNEMKIMQQHNNELIDLTSKRGEIEQENVELKKKLTEQLHNQETLKNAFNAEQANITALKSSNEQLLGKLQELQKNIDTLTIQFSSFQTQTEKPETSKATQISTRQTDMKYPQATDKTGTYRNNANQMERCRKCCEAYDKILHLEENLNTSRRNVNPTNKSAQTEFEEYFDPVQTKDQETMMTPVKQNPIKKNEPVPVNENIEQKPLSSEKMLKLLEQAQIGTISDSTRFSQKNLTKLDELDLKQRHSDTEKIAQKKEEFPLPRQMSQYDQSPNNTSPTQITEGQFPDPYKILSILYNILQGYSQSTIDKTSLYRPAPPSNYQLVRDTNNNIATKHHHFTNPPFEFVVADGNVAASSLSTGCSAKWWCSRPQMFNSEKSKRPMFCDIKKRSRITKCHDCPCSNPINCNVDSNCEQQGCRVALESTEDTNDKTKDVKNVASVEKNKVIAEDHSTQNTEKKNELSNDKDELQPNIDQVDQSKELANRNHILNVTGISVKRIAEETNLKDPLRYRDISDDPMAESHMAEITCSQDCPNECLDALSSLSESFPLIIGEGQGLVEFHIASLQLSSCAKQVLFGEGDIGNLTLFVSWDLWNQETTYTPPLKCPKLNFNSSFVYRISDLFSFFNYVLSEFVIFQVNVFHETMDSYVVARGKLCIKDILDYPQNKLHYIAPVNSVIPCSLGMNFGQLSLWIRLSCDVEKVESFKKTRGIHTETQAEDYRHDVSEATLKEDVKPMDGTASKARLIYGAAKQSVPDYPSLDLAEDSSDKSDVPVTTVRRTYSQLPLTVVKESDDEIPFEASSMHTNLDAKFVSSPKLVDPSGSSLGRDFAKSSGSKETIEDKQLETETTSDFHSPSVDEFNAIMSEENYGGMARKGSTGSVFEVRSVIADKNWAEYKRRSQLTFARSDTDTVKSATDPSITNDSISEKDTITIDIVSMNLFPTSTVMEDDEVKLLYIEFSFLGYCGADMETVSVKKPRPPNTKLMYNFSKRFQVDEEKHSMQNSILRAMLDDSTNPNIRFIVVSEPVPEETDTKECVEVGFANFNLKEYGFGETEKYVSLPIYSMDETEQIGLLKIYVSGIETIRMRLGRRESNL